ncbi:MAG: MarR family transcriptional regulator [Sphingomonas sp.]|jgi:DNA-binding MarR family transcriptional regulator|uniref:MarR family winged helix-turn-helix transcriptional regulator n=1 Tax=Sphingomonas sp. TaxID=28214 RepID=UPI003562434A
MTQRHDAASFGAALRQLLDRLDSPLERAYRDAGLDFRPRFTPVIRALAVDGPQTLSALSVRLGVSHSAVSQTVSQMAARDLVMVAPGRDARERIVALGPVATRIMPQLEQQWDATARATAALDRETGSVLIDAVNRANAALATRPFRDRLLAAAGADDA